MTGIKVWAPNLENQKESFPWKSKYYKHKLEDHKKLNIKKELNTWKNPIEQMDKGWKLFGK